MYLYGAAQYKYRHRGIHNFLIYNHRYKIDFMFKHYHVEGPQQLETLLAQSALEATLFLPFTIFRLRPYAVDQQVALTVSLYEADNKTPQTHKHTSWN